MNKDTERAKKYFHKPEYLSQWAQVNNLSPHQCCNDHCAFVLLISFTYISASKVPQIFFLCSVTSSLLFFFLRGTNRWLEVWTEWPCFSSTLSYSSNCLNLSLNYGLHAFAGLITYWFLIILLKYRHSTFSRECRSAGEEKFFFLTTSSLYSNEIDVNGDSFWEDIDGEGIRLGV